MRSTHVTLLLMLAAATVAILGGTRLARHEVITRTPADRVRLQDFTDAFQAELARLVDVYEEHLSRIATSAEPNDAGQVRELCATAVGIRECHIFRKSTAAPALSVSLHGGEKSPVPEVVIKGGKQPLNHAKAVIVPVEIFSGSMRRGWLRATDAAWRVYWQRVGDRFVVMLIEAEKVRRVTEEHLEQWMPPVFAPLRESGELVGVRGTTDVLAGVSAVPQAPIALTVPLRNALGAWEVSAWDRVAIHTEYEPATLAVAITIGALLALLGVMLFVQQRRALRLAEERVSFVNRVSHELGTPLTNVLLNLALADDALDVQPARARSRLKLVTEEMQRLARLVGNVLTFSRSERGALALTPGPCVPDAVLADVVAQFEPTLTRRSIRIEWQRGAGDGVNLAADALAQIAGNLICNVEKYAAAGEWLGLRSALDGDTLIVSISDRGPGIPARDRVRIFEPFERVDSRVNEGSSGTGLGLAIARELAARLGGTLTLLPTETGSCFELCVPAPRVIVALEKENAA